MEKLRIQVRRARRRLLLEQFLKSTAVCLFIGFCLASAGISVAKLYPVPVAEAVWHGVWIGGALGAAVVASGIWTVAVRRSELDAAIEIDRRFGLKERVSSTLSLAPDELTSEAGSALLEDAVRRVDRVSVPEKFTVAASRRGLLPLVPAAVAIALLFLPNAERDDVSASVTEKAAREQVRQPVERLEKKMGDRRKEAEKKDLKEAAELLKKVEAGVRQTARDEKVDRKKALVKLGDLAKELDERRKKIGDSQKIRDQLNQLKPFKSGDALRDMANALKEGDMQKAMDEIDRLKSKLDGGKLDEEAKQALADQTADLAQQLRKMADAQKKAEEDLKREIEKQRGAGNDKQADELERKLQELRRQSPQREKLEDLAKKMGQCGDCLKEGDVQNAAEQLAALADDLNDLQQQLAEDELLEEALDQIAMAKDAMTCEACKGQGCKACQGNGDGQGDGSGQGKGNMAGKSAGGQGDQRSKHPGVGNGPGRGVGPRAEQEDTTGEFDTNVRQNVGPGRAVAIGEVGGTNRRQRALTEINAEKAKAEDRRDDDPTAGQRLPRKQRDHSREYFEKLREGK